MLAVAGLEVSLGRTRVLHGVSLSVAAGETLALVGANGAGKTTLLRALSGLVRSSGSITLDGQDLTPLSAADRVRTGLVQLPGGRALWEQMTVAETLATACFTLPRSTSSERTAEVLELFPVLRDRLGQRAGSLSGGEQQVLALAKAMVLHPRVLLIDELSLGLSPVAVASLVATLQQLQASGTTMVVVEQTTGTAARLAGRAVVLDKGEVTFDGPLADAA